MKWQMCDRVKHVAGHILMTIKWATVLQPTLTKQASLQLQTCFCGFKKTPSVHMAGTGSNIQPTAVCMTFRRLISRKHSECDVWECVPSLCDVAWRKATGRSRWQQRWCYNSVRPSPVPVCTVAFWSTLRSKWNNLWSPPLSCLLNTAAHLKKTKTLNPHKIIF